MSALSGDGHDYLWARLPFLVPMAAKMARQCCGPGRSCEHLAELVEELRGLVLNHLDVEERTLAGLGTELDDAQVAARLAELSAQHDEVLGLLQEVCDAAGVPLDPGEESCPTARAFYDELARLDRYLRAQLMLEDGVLAARIARHSPPP